MKKRFLPFVLFICLFLNSCDALDQFATGFNNASGACRTYRCEVWSYDKGEWKKGLYTSTSLTNDVVENINNWAKEINQNFVNSRKTGYYYKNDPYTNREYQFRSTCY